MSNHKNNNLNHSNTISHDVVFEGDIIFEDNLEVSGFIVGTISSQEGSLLVTPEGKVNGAISVVAVSNKGSIQGLIKTNTTTLHKQSCCDADIETKELMIEKGAKITGNVKVSE